MSRAILMILECGPVPLSWKWCISYPEEPPHDLATKYTHYYYYNNSTFFSFKLFATRHTSTLLLLLLLFIFSLHRSRKPRYSYFIYLLLFFRSIHLSNQNMSISINKSNYVHKFLIFLTYKLIKWTLIKIEIFQRISKVFKTNYRI